MLSNTSRSYNRNDPVKSDTPGLSKKSAKKFAPLLDLYFDKDMFKSHGDLKHRQVQTCMHKTKLNATANPTYLVIFLFISQPHTPAPGAYRVPVTI